MQNSIGLKFGHALAKFAQRVAILSSSFTSFAFTKYRRAQIALVLDLCCFCMALICRFIRLLFVNLFIYSCYQFLFSSFKPSGGFVSLLLFVRGEIPARRTAIYRLSFR